MGVDGSRVFWCTTKHRLFCTWHITRIKVQETQNDAGSQEVKDAPQVWRQNDFISVIIQLQNQRDTVYLHSMLQKMNIWIYLGSGSALRLHCPPPVNRYLQRLGASLGVVIYLCVKEVETKYNELVGFLLCPHCCSWRVQEWNTVGLVWEGVRTVRPVSGVQDRQDHCLHCLICYWVHAKRKRKQNHVAGQHAGVEGATKKRTVDAESHISHENWTNSWFWRWSNWPIIVQGLSSQWKRPLLRVTYNLKLNV